MYINIENILKDRGKSIRWLSKEIDCNYSSLWRLCNNKSIGIEFALLQNICLALNITPNDIFIIDRNM